MDLYVLRHGLAAARGSVEYPYDTDRPLTPKGTRRMVRQARGLNALGLSLDVILTSPLVRALETAKIVHRELDLPGRPVESEALAPMAHPAKLIDQLAMDYPSASNVMIVTRAVPERPHIADRLRRPGADDPAQKGSPVQAAPVRREARTLRMDRMVHDPQAHGEARMTQQDSLWDTSRT